MLWSPKDLWDILKGVVHVSSFWHEQYPQIATTKIIEPMVFVDYPNEGITFLLGFGMVMQYLSKFQ